MNVKKNKDQTIYIAVQSSSVNWSGGKNLDVKEIKGQPVVFWTIKKVIDDIPNASLTILAPKFDENGALNALVKILKKPVTIFYGFDDSPLDRLLSAYKNLNDEDYVLRIDGLNFGFDTSKAVEMHNYAVKKQIDCLKFPDDFPVQLTFDVYRIGALRKVKAMLRKDENAYKIHPKYYMFKNPSEFKAEYYKSLPIYSKKELSKLRKHYKSVFEIREGSVGNRIRSGDTLNFHYEIALQHIDKNMVVLDIACGEGYGTGVLCQKAKSVIGSDLDANSIKTAKKLHSEKNVSFCVQDVLKTSFKDESFDLITSMETIEHIGPKESSKKYFREMKRLLKKGGHLIFSTPQNSLGHTPMNNQHAVEYSLGQMMKLAKEYFKIENVIGIKQGCIVIPGQPKGTNMILVCSK